MTLALVLAVLALAQGAFLVLLFLLLTAHRAAMTRRHTADVHAGAAVAVPLNDWLAGHRPVQDVAAVLAALPEDDAVHELLEAGARVPGQQLDELADAVRHAPWVERTLRDAQSRFWWRRLTAARVLGVAGVPGDAGRVMALLRDPHPAVRAVASAAVPRVADATVVAVVIDEFPGSPPIVRSAQLPVLARLWALAEPELKPRLGSPAPSDRLRAWVTVADAIGTPALLECARALTAHPDREVRIAAAGAMRKYFAPAALHTLRSLLADPDWRVRARAAQSLGIIGAADAVPELARTLHDENWWVRFRTGLSLAQLGEAGRAVLRRTRGESDRPAADMAAMITGLSPGSLAELSEG